MSQPGRRRAPMRSRARRVSRVAIIVACFVPFALGCGGGSDGNREHGSEAGAGQHVGEPAEPPAGEPFDPMHIEADVEIPLRTPQLATFPCVEQCHRAQEPNPAPRELRSFHSAKHIEHGDTTFWCNFCHNLENLDSLRLLDGRTVSFDEAYRLCGECHGDKRRDWALGIHGLQTGFWNGQKSRRTCTACHDPHAPRRPRFQALPAPHPRTGE